MATYTRSEDIVYYVTKDGSRIREFIHPSIHGNTNLSLAEAVVLPGKSTFSHYHRLSEELYHVTQGVGQVTVGKDTVEVKAGDTVCIPPGTVHNATNTGAEDLKILCIMSPPYSHDDTILIDSDSRAQRPTS